jgi:hypothetical protein
MICICVVFQSKLQCNSSHTAQSSYILSREVVPILGWLTLYRDAGCGRFGNHAEYAISRTILSREQKTDQTGRESAVLLIEGTSWIFFARIQHTVVSRATAKICKSQMIPQYDCKINTGRW